MPEPRGKQTRLNQIQARYRRAMMAVYDHPEEERAGLIREALDTLRREKVAVGEKDSDTADSED
jgi:hypothetical protein